MLSNPVEDPTDAELASIDAEWPVIEAELAELDAVIRIVSASQEPSLIEVQAYRRAQRRVLREMRVYLDAYATGERRTDVA